MLLSMQICDELRDNVFFFYALERTVFIRAREATNYFRLMTPPVDQSDSNEFSDPASRYVINRRVVIWLAVVWPPLQLSAYLVMGNIPG